MRPGLPLYVGRRWRSSQGDKLILERWTLRQGRMPVRFDDCPECVKDIEVGHDSLVPACWNLGKFLIRAETTAEAAAIHGARFTDLVIAQLPTTMPWSMDACSIRDWVNGEGLVLCHYGGADRYLPTPKSAQQTLELAGARAVNTPPAAMDDVLERIDGNAF